MKLHLRGDFLHQVVSLPTRERELKLSRIQQADNGICVAPHAGARIETLCVASCLLYLRVAPHAGARIETLPDTVIPASGLVAPHAGARIETSAAGATGRLVAVAPHAGARIETRSGSIGTGGRYVAPHAGARIETRQIPVRFYRETSLPTRERELKRYRDWRGRVVPASLPTRERELKRAVYQCCR